MYMYIIILRVHYFSDSETQQIRSMDPSDQIRMFSFSQRNMKNNECKGWSSRQAPAPLSLPLFKPLIHASWLNLAVELKRYKVYL